MRLYYYNLNHYNSLYVSGRIFEIIIGRKARLNIVWNVHVCVCQFWPEFEFYFNSEISFHTCFAVPNRISSFDICLLWNLAGDVIMRVVFVVLFVLGSGLCLVFLPLSDADGLVYGGGLILLCSPVLCLNIRLEGSGGTHPPISKTSCDVFLPEQSTASPVNSLTTLSECQNKNLEMVNKCFLECHNECSIKCQSLLFVK